MNDGFGLVLNFQAGSVWFETFNNPGIMNWGNTPGRACVVSMGAVVATRQVRVRYPLAAPLKPLPREGDAYTRPAR